MLVYLDNCTFNRPFDDQSQMRILLETEAKLEIQTRIRSGTLKLAWSYMMDFENDANPFEDRRASIYSWRNLAVVDISESDDVVARAEDLNGLGFKAKDAIHISCAIQAHCRFFLSTDKGILKKASLVPELAILNPVDYHFADDDD